MILDLAANPDAHREGDIGAAAILAPQGRQREKKMPERTRRKILETP